MSEADLDACYTALAKAIAKCGEPKAPLMLSTLCLALIARHEGAAPVLELIEQAVRLSDA